VLKVRFIDIPAAQAHDTLRQCAAESPARNVNFMHALVADITVAEIPEPMPVVMNQVRVERLFRRRPGPDVEVEVGGGGSDRLGANGPAWLAAITFGHQE